MEDSDSFASPITFPGGSRPFSALECCATFVSLYVLSNEGLELVRIRDGVMINVGVVLGRAAATRIDAMLWSNAGILSLKIEDGLETRELDS